MYKWLFRPTLGLDTSNNHLGGHRDGKFADNVILCLSGRSNMRAVLTILAGVIIIIVADAILQKIRTPATCGVAPAFLLPDKCAGPCPAGTVPPCAPTLVGPYGPGGMFGTQPTACACALGPPPPPPGTGGTPPAGGTPPTGTPPIFTFGGSPNPIFSIPDSVIPLPSAGD